jgi:UDP-GlcNAc:undecaprenyl-phosphate GlcNAc-1-phosphate transferase
MKKIAKITKFQRILFLIGLIVSSIAFFKFPIAESEKVFGFYLFFFSFFLCLNLTLVFRKAAKTFNIYDHPNERKFHSHPTPLLGGMAIFFSFLFTIVLFERHIDNTMILYWILGMSFIILIMGAIDDYKELSAKIRLLVQFSAAGVVIYHGVRLSFLPNNVVGDTFEVILSLFWIVGITNAINFIDGMDGLATGYIIITASLLGIVAYQLVMPEYLFVLLALVGACCGFFPYNFRWHGRAMIFLGDSGATFLGFFMGCLTLLGKWGSRNDVFHSTNEVGVIIPLLILGVAVFDTIFTYAMRLREGNITQLDHLLTYAGKDHFHHCLHDIGLPEKAIVVVIFMITLCLGLGSIALRNARKIDAVILLIQAIIVFALIGAFMAFVKKTHITPNNGNNGDKPD